MRMLLAVQVREDVVDGKDFTRRPTVVDIVRSCRLVGRGQESSSGAVEKMAAGEQR